MDEPAVLEGGIASRAEEVEAPLLQAGERIFLPVNLVRELPLVHLVVDAALSALAVVPLVLHMIYWEIRRKLRGDKRTAEGAG